MAFAVADIPGRGTFGAIVTGLANADIGDPAVAERLRTLWIDRGVIVFRGVDGTPETQMRLSAMFGDLLDHPLAPKGLAFPKLSTVKYVPGESDVYKVDGERRGGWLPWHFDLVYVDFINRGGIIRPVTLPRRGGQTGFICQIDAYDSLPADLARAIAGRNVLYRFNINSAEMKYGGGPDRAVHVNPAYLASMERFKGRPRSIHPAVYEQRETGRKVLNVSPWFADGIEGMEDAEGDELLRRVIEHVCDPALAYFHDWRADDMVLWDNWRMLHCACGVPEDDNRLIQRTTIAGDYGHGRLEGDGTATEEMRAVSV
jgi:taurine dioxygenase